MKKNLLIITSAVLSMLFMSVLCAQETTIGGQVNSNFTFNNERATFGNPTLYLNIGSELSDDISVSTELVGNGLGTGLNQAYVDFKYNDSITARVGKTLVPFGRAAQNYRATNAALITDEDSNVLSNRWVDSGAGVHGTSSITGFDLTYQAYLFNGVAANTAENNDNKAIAARVGASPLENLDVAGSYYTAKIDSADEYTQTLIGVDAAYTYDNYQFIAEYAAKSVEAATDTDSNALYVEARADVLQDQIATILPQLDDAVVTAYARYAIADPNTDTDDNEINRVTVGANFKPVNNVGYILEYQTQTVGEGDADATIYGAVTVGF
jgi:hypothetical protein